MFKTILLASSVIALASCNNEAGTDTKKEDSAATTQTTISGPQQNSLTDQEKKDGWELLFDGVSTAGWHLYGNRPVDPAWKVEDGAIRLDASNKKVGNGSRDIVTDSEYENFDLKYDWKIDTSGNSGLIFLLHEDSAKYDQTYLTGPEMQVLDNERHPDSKIIKHRAGDLYDLISSSKETVKPALEWNSAEIKVENGKLDLFLNGTNVVSTTMWDDNWKKLIAGSKFKKMKEFGTFKKGRIALQDHGNNVWYRNVKLRKL
ncbi:MAG TPA: DUF1080 domain-containing protein [Chitinophagaceae bacterium]|nr:DUF1080 domain-containing protein [Chitinophagaceae bacterium]